MEINADLHAILRGTLSQSDGSRHVIVAATVTVAVLIIGIVPDPETDIVHTSLRQRHKYILLFSVKVIIFHATVFQSQYCGYVHTTVKIIGNAVHRLHINGRVLRPFRLGKSDDIRGICSSGNCGFCHCICDFQILTAASGQPAHDQSRTEIQSQQPCT